MTDNSIDFTPARWQKIKATYRAWWAGELERPLIPVILRGRDPGRPCPSAPLLTQENCTDFSWSAEELIDRIDYELSRQVYLGDAYPYFNMDCFGPGVAAAFLGARLDNSSGRVWFFPPDDRPIQDIHFEYDPDNVWLQRIKAIYKAAMERWQGRVLMSMTDLGGNLDILSTFRPAERILLDLYDSPDEVVRLLWEAHEMWHRFYNELNDVLQPVNPGYSDWAMIYSETPSYMLQCDFSYMISSKMFQQFALPELQATCKRLPHAFYHLDGIGQVPHLPYLTAIEDLRGIQWVHGDGKPDSAHWPAVFREIQQGGKLIQVMSGDFDTLETIRGQIGALKGVFFHGQTWQPYGLEGMARLRDELARFGVE